MQNGLVAFGIILLLAGASASVYPEVKTIYEPFSGQTFEISRTYPYQTLGMILVVAGIILSAIGFFYTPQKPPTSNNTPNTPTS